MQTAIIDGEEALTYRELEERVQERAKILAGIPQKVILAPMSNDLDQLINFFPTFTVAKPKNPHKSRYICVYGDFFIFWYVDMHACVCLFSRRGEYLLTQAHPECR